MGAECAIEETIPLAVAELRCETTPLASPVSVITSLIYILASAV